jgi:membrane associated rhomboid family serine protease
MTDPEPDPLKRDASLSPADADATDQPEAVPFPAKRLVEFYGTLAVLTPHVVVTPVLIGLNVLVFVLMAATGVHLLEPKIPDLLRWGANFGPMTIAGEWWRLLTSTFVHIGIIHILLNMWVLAVAGPLVERMVGNIGFLLLYLVSGLTGSLASLLWRPDMVSAGASGAIFGIYGALLGFLLLQRHSIPAEALKNLRSSGVGFILYNLVYGMMQPNVDVAAHLGGLAGGFLCGLVLSQPLTPRAPAGRFTRNGLVAGLGVLLISAGMITVNAKHSELAGVMAELGRLESVEKNALDTSQKAAAKFGRNELSAKDFAEILERDVLPPWRELHQRLQGLSHVPETYRKHLTAVVEYLRLRQEGWELLVQALREGNPVKAQQAEARQSLANAAAKRIVGDQKH